jgi:hypothetical protein
MSAWHAVVDSDAFRWFAKRGPGRPLFRSRLFRVLNVERSRFIAARAVQHAPSAFADVRTFCFFVGHNKSGTSLMGGLLDAHAQVVLADEADVLQYVDAGFGRDEIFQVLARGARTEARKGRVTARRLQPYSYAVPGQWQGRSERPRVLGDSTSGTSTRRLRTQPQLVDRLQALMTDIDVKIVQVIRNPFDPISLMMVRGRRSFENSIRHYFAACETLVDIRRRVGREQLLEVRYEDVVADPGRALRSACAFLGVQADDEYVHACASIIRSRPDHSREIVAWPTCWIDQVERHIAAFDFLEGYSYAS